MSYSKITARIIDSTIELTNLPLLASGSVGVVQIHCDFCELWEGYGKTAVFHKESGQVYHVAVVDNVATVPHEVLAEEGDFFFGVLGQKDNIRTTQVLRLNVVQGAITTATAETEEPTPDIYQQILAAYGSLENRTDVLEARTNELIGRRSADGATVYTFNDGTGEGTITTNGAAAFFECRIRDLFLDAEDGYFVNNIPAYLEPLVSVPISISSILLAGGETTTPKGLQAGMHKDVDSGRFYFELYNGSPVSDPIDISYALISGSYSLAGLSIPELADIRAGADGTSYPNAGEAVRAQAASGTKYANALRKKTAGNPLILSGVSPIPQKVEARLDGAGATYGKGEELADTSYSSISTFNSGTGVYEVASVKMPTYDEDDNGTDSGVLTFTDGSQWADEQYDIPKATWETFKVGTKLYYDESTWCLYTVTVTNQGQTITAYGKNLWDNATAYFSSSTAITRTETGFSFERSTTGAAYYVLKKIPMKKGVTYTFYADTTPATSINAMLYIYADKVYGQLLKSIASMYKKVTYTADADYPEARFTFMIGATAPSLVAENIMVCVAGHTDDYAPYLAAKTYTTDENGTAVIPVNGTDMTLFADATITAEYSRDINKAFEELEQRIAALSANA